MSLLETLVTHKHTTSRLAANVLPPGILSATPLNS
ncbi:hypothetical protein SBA4_2650013 [Candidatus Sulfopaludibacter sp. SbA4]|nr:hypothetical protein SBA4_2650013 [Candidatus Sulfopaludibacter sp. SbA4]